MNKTAKERIISYLQSSGLEIDDDELAKELNLGFRQQANKICRELEHKGLVQRNIKNGKIHNLWIGVEKISPLEIGLQTIKNKDNYHDLWFWEGNVQKVVMKYLRSVNYQILSVADTATHQRGIDIIGEINGSQIWVSVKGYPKGTDKTKPGIQASHWFKQAIFDMVEYRQKNEAVILALAFPNMDRFHAMSKKVIWLKEKTVFNYFWVNEDKSIIIE